MSAREREQTYILKWRSSATRGNTMAMLNVAAGYRLLGNTRVAFRWFKRAADAGDGSGLAEVGYCYQHGLGVQRNVPAAKRAYRAAIKSRYISDYEREEAMYNLAVLLLRARRGVLHREAASLLRAANADGDYPQAAALAAQVATGEVNQVCICRRAFKRNVARNKCPLHGPRAAQQLRAGDGPLRGPRLTRGR